MSQPGPDPRAVRSRELLREAVLELAGRCPVQDVTVTELADRAGVHRSTVYEYASSPAALLAGVLVAELDEIRVRDLVDVPLAEVGGVVRRSMADVMAHVDAHAAVYRQGLVASTGLWQVLSDHFRGSAAILVDRLGGTGERGIREVTAGVVASGAVGAIAAWLAADPPLPAASVLDAYVRLLGDWPARTLS